MHQTERDFNKSAFGRFDGQHGEGESSGGETAVEEEKVAPYGICIKCVMKISITWTTFTNRIAGRFV